MRSAQQQNIFAVVLAAGQSLRFGATKMLQTLNGEAIVYRAAKLARRFAAENSLLVVGHDAEAVVTAAGRQCQFVVVNDSYAEGIGTSIAAAARCLPPSARGMILLLADQPLVTNRHLEALLAAWSGDDNEIVATAFAGAQGPPVLFPRGSFADLARLGGDRGARALLGNPDYEVSTVWFDEAAIDIDTPEDLSRVADASDWHSARS